MSLELLETFYADLQLIWQRKIGRTIKVFSFLPERFFHVLSLQNQKISYVGPSAPSQRSYNPKLEGNQYLCFTVDHFEEPKQRAKDWDHFEWTWH
uniref:Uncharacterized protein n=1 Tax=Theropithecus gelada TaxID=9565 RepID=A0A8D2EMW6_THEGE